MSSFFLDNPLKLITDLTVFPDESQDLESRMNTLARLVILVAIVLYLLKVQGGMMFLLFGIFLIIILYYTQKGRMADSKSGLAFPLPAQAWQGISAYGSQGNVPSSKNPNIGSVFYDAKHGPPLLHEPPVLAPSPADAIAFGGHFALLNVPQPKVLRENYEGQMYSTQFPPKYSSQIQYNSGAPQNQPRREGFAVPTYPENGPLNPLSGITPPPSEGNYTMFPPFTTPPNLLPGGVYAAQSMRLDGNQREVPQRNTRLPAVLAVEGKDDRFDGNDYYVHHRSVHNPGQSYDFVQPINDSNGIAYIPNARNSNFEYTAQNLPDWNPNLVRDNVSHQRQLAQSTRDFPSEDISPYRSKPTLNIQEHLYNPQYDGNGDQYRAYEDIRSGNTQYYYDNVDPFAGPMYITRSRVDHMDYMDPMGRVIPKYVREGVTDQDYMDLVMDRQMADELYHRENMVSEITSKMNERDYAMRMAPMRGTPGQMGGGSVRIRR